MKKIRTFHYSLILTILFGCAYGNVRCQDFISVKDYGALGDGKTDDAKSIEATISSAAASHKIVFFPEGVYVIRQQVHILGKLMGVKNKSTIIVSDDFVFSEKINGRNYSVLLNKNFKGKRDVYADDVDIENINFEYAAEKIPQTAISLLGLADIKKGIIKGCYFKINKNAGGFVTAIDLWASVSNMTIVSNVMENFSQEKAGGCLWISNITTAGGDAANDTHDILVDSCTFKSASKDEAFAIFGVEGVSRNIILRNSNFEALPSSQIHSVLASVFPLNDGTPGGKYAAVKNVIIDNCIFTDDFFSAHVLRIGQESDKNQICDSVLIINNKFYVHKSKNEISFIARNIKCTGDDVEFVKNSLYASQSNAPIYYGVHGFDIVRENYITGNFKNVIAGSKLVAGNTLERIVGKPFDKAGLDGANRVKN